MTKYEREPALLKRRVAELKGTKFEIPDEVYRRAMIGQALFDRVLLWQVPEGWYGSNTYDGSLIQKAPSTEQRQYESTPRGLVLSIGLAAVDSLASNGVGVGHYVHFAALSPYRRPLDDHDKNHIILVRAGDLVDSEDLAEALDRGIVSVVDDGGTAVLKDGSGKIWTPRCPWMEE